MVTRFYGVAHFNCCVSARTAFSLVCGILPFVLVVLCVRCLGHDVRSNALYSGRCFSYLGGPLHLAFHAGLLTHFLPPYIYGSLLSVYGGVCSWRARLIYTASAPCGVRWILRCWRACHFLLLVFARITFYSNSLQQHQTIYFAFQWWRRFCILQMILRTFETAA